MAAPEKPDGGEDAGAWDSGEGDAGLDGGDNSDGGEGDGGNANDGGQPDSGTDAGTTDGGQPTDAGATDGGASNWAQVAAGWYHTCATRTDGTQWCWGQNDYGQLGNGGTSGVAPNRDPMEVVGGASPWTRVSAGGYHTCAAGDGGTLWCWGWNSKDQLGDGTTVDSHSPVKVDGGATNWAQVSAGAFHTCATRSEGSLWCWGQNSEGRLGDNSTTSRSSPVSVDSANTWAFIGAGYRHTCATRTDGTAWCWGWNLYGQLGDGTTDDSHSPVKVDGGATNWEQVSAGTYHTCATRQDGGLWCWGDNFYGQLGDGTDARRQSPVLVVGGATNWAQVSAGMYHTCATGSDGTLWCWGLNFYGQLGNGGTSGVAPNPDPVEVVGGASPWAQVSAGGEHTCATGDGGTLWCWGANSVGQLGNGTDAGSPTPVQVK